MKRNLLGAMLLISGTCVGGGILALPVETGVAGFLPSVVVMGISWMFMTLTGLYYAEANLWLKEGAHVMTMASKLLGPIGKYAALLLFLFIDYASLVAYNAGGGALLEHVLDVSRTAGLMIFAFGFGSIIILGTQRIGRINSLLVAGMIAAYLAMIGLGVSDVKMSLLRMVSWKVVPFALPLVLTTFSFQMIVPSLTTYLKRDPRLIYQAIIWGTSVPFVIYLAWQLVVLGLVPVSGLQEAFFAGSAAVEPLRRFIQSRWLSYTADMFAFFAIVTSYLGIGLSLYDFLSDSLKVHRKGVGKLVLGILVVIPSLLFAIVYPRAFLVALEVTGGYGDSLLNGLIPVAMIWVGRYVKNLIGPMRVWGEKRTLIAMGCFAAFVIGVQTASLCA